MVASTAAALLNLRLYVLNAQNLPQSYTAETDLLLRLWEREAVLTESALLVEADERDDRISGVQTQLLEAVDSPIILSTNHPHAGLGRPRAAFHTGKPTRREQAEIWHTWLNGENVNGTVETLVSQFSLSPVAIRSAAMRAEASVRPTGALEASFTDELWNTCRLLARPRLTELAQRIESTVTWSDLVLPEREQELLRRIALHVRQRVKVYESWGFAARGSRGLGISALFAGASGTGKTMAAEVLANELRLDLFRIDLSQVVSKYIGETEKNLSRVFDAAEEGASILLFDEADALFGKRSEVKDSHDRYANVEVSYLLQRMEAYRGLAILTSNRKNALDQAFLRRIRFADRFSFSRSRATGRDVAAGFSFAYTDRRPADRSPGAVARFRRQHPEHRHRRGLSGRRRAATGAYAALAFVYPERVRQAGNTTGRCGGGGMGLKRGHPQSSFGGSDRGAHRADRSPRLRTGRHAPSG